MEEKKPYEPNDMIVWYKCAACGAVYHEDGIECKRCHGYLEEKETSVAELFKEPGFEASIGLEVEEENDEMTEDDVLEIPGDDENEKDGN